MSNDLINPEPCNCNECNDSTEILVSYLWRGHTHDVAIIYCSKCKEVEPVKVMAHIQSSSDFSQIMYKAWNQRNSDNQLNRAIELLEACSEDLFINENDKELEYNIDTFLREMKS